MIVAGVDGCRGRWLVVRRSIARPGAAVPAASVAPAATTAPSAELVDDLAPLLDEVRLGRVAAVAIDMPIGLLHHHPRAADVLARRHLGPRRSSVFPTPVLATLHAVDYDDARRRSRAAVGVAPSLQAFNLLPAIRHLDALVTAADQDRVVEAHPELAFARLAGAPLAEPKRTSDGRAQRRALLVDHDPTLEPLFDTSGLPAVDLLDAASLTITAGRVVSGRATHLGHEIDERGRRAEIVW